MFLRSGWSVVSASLAKEVLQKRDQHCIIHKVPTQSNEVSPQTLKMALVYVISFKFSQNFFYSLYLFCSIEEVVRSTLK